MLADLFVKRICRQGLTELPTNIRDDSVSSAQALARLTRQLAITEERARVAERKTRVTQNQLAVRRENEEKLQAGLSASKTGGGDAFGGDAESNGVAANNVTVGSKPLSVVEKKQKRIGERTIVSVHVPVLQCTNTCCVLLCSAVGCLEIAG